MKTEYYYLILAAGTLIAAFSQVLLKTAASKERKSFWADYLNPHVIIGYAMMALSTLCTIIAYKRVDYKNGPVVEALGFLYIMLLSYFFFKEKITKRKFLGNCIIILGLIIFYL